MLPIPVKPEGCAIAHRHPNEGRSFIFREYHIEAVPTKSETSALVDLDAAAAGLFHDAICQSTIVCRPLVTQLENTERCLCPGRCVQMPLRMCDACENTMLIQSTGQTRIIGEDLAAIARHVWSIEAPGKVQGVQRIEGKIGSR